MNRQAFHKTRIAPTPSGYLHIGNAYSFLLTAKLAKSTGAKILLRIDDLDAQRMRKEYVQDIFDTLDYLEISWDEGPRNEEEYEKEFSQLKRMPLYNKALEQLMNNGLVYACSCSRTKLETAPCDCRDKKIAFDQPDTALRLITDEKEEIAVKTFDKGIIRVTLPAEIQNFIVRKKDGTPSYQQASLIDDVYFNIDLIVRGEDLWNSTLAQLYLAEKAGIKTFLNTVFYHHTLLKDTKGEKLSKSAGALSLRELRKKYSSQDLLRQALPFPADFPFVH